MRGPIVLLVSATMLVSACTSRRPTGSSSASIASRNPSQSTSSASADRTPPPSGAMSALRPPVSARTGTVVTTAASQFGPVLFDRTGQAIYVFDAEKTRTPTCYGDCALAWPPVLTNGQPVAGGAVRQDLLGVTTRRGALSQATYGGRPLYFYAHEGKHQVLCHNVTEFGGRWLAITAAAGPAPT
jgi:predicted lipoprotein with Yx(FWY)xxD motif